MRALQLGSSVRVILFCNRLLQTLKFGRREMTLVGAGVAFSNCLQGRPNFLTHLNNSQFRASNRLPSLLGSCSPVCPLGVLCCVCGVLSHFNPVHPCARAVYCVACAVSFVSWLLFTAVHARCVVCAVSLTTWLLFTGVPIRCVVLRVWNPWPLRSCSPVCPVGLVCFMCGVLGHLAPVHRCARFVCCVVCVGGVGVHTKKPRCTGRVPCGKTNGTGNRTRQ